MICLGGFNYWQLQVFGPAAPQRDLYEQAVMPIVNEVLEGFNCSTVVYLLRGKLVHVKPTPWKVNVKELTKWRVASRSRCYPGAVQQIFDALESQNAEYSVKVTFLELYNEEITDLLALEELSRVSVDDKQKKQLPLMEDGSVPDFSGMSHGSRFL